MTPTAPPQTSLPYADRDVTKPPDWHGLVVWDLVFNALATGLFLAAAPAELVNPARFGPVCAWAYPLALVLLSVDLLCLVLDLGDPLRFHHMLRVFKPSSPMSLGTWCLTAYSLPLTLIVAVDLALWLGWLPADSDAVAWGRTALLVLGLPAAFGSAMYKGVLFSTTSQPGWKDARWLGAYHTTSAVMLGAAVLLFLAVQSGHGEAVAALRPAVCVLIGLAAVLLGLLLAELRPELVRRTGPRNYRDVAAAGLGVGALVPFVWLLLSGSPASVAVVTGWLLVGSWAVRAAVVHLPHHPPPRA